MTHVFVWTVQDMIGFGILALMIVIGLLFAFAYGLEQLLKWLRKMIGK